jgi:hypothetical protein
MLFRKVLLFSLGGLFVCSSTSLAVDYNTIVVRRKPEFQHWIRMVAPLDCKDPYAQGNAMVPSMKFFKVFFNEKTSTYAPISYFVVFVSAKTGGQPYRIEHESSGLSCSDSLIDVKASLFMVPQYSPDDKWISKKTLEVEGPVQGDIQKTDGFGLENIKKKVENAYFGNWEPANISSHRVLYNCNSGNDAIIRCVYRIFSDTDNEKYMLENIAKGKSTDSLENYLITDRKLKGMRKDAKFGFTVKYRLVLIGENKASDSIMIGY